MPWNIIVVGSSPETTEMLRLNIACMQHNVVATTDHMAAIEMARVAPNLFVIELLFGDFDILQQLRVAAGTRVPAIGVTNSRDDRIYTLAMCAGFDGWLAPSYLSTDLPFDPYQLNDEIRRILEDVPR